MPGKGAFGHFPGAIDPPPPQLFRSCRQMDRQTKANNCFLFPWKCAKKWNYGEFFPSGKNRGIWKSKIWNFRIIHEHILPLEWIGIMWYCIHIPDPFNAKPSWKCISSSFTLMWCWTAILIVVYLQEKWSKNIVCGWGEMMPSGISQIWCVMAPFHDPALDSSFDWCSLLKMQVTILGKEGLLVHQTVSISPLSHGS